MVKRHRDLVWQRGFEDGLEGAVSAIKRMQIAMKKNPIVHEPYWAGYAKAVLLALDHMKTMAAKAQSQEH